MENLLKIDQLSPATPEYMPQNAQYIAFSTKWQAHRRKGWQCKKWPLFVEYAIA
jgi:hypothetical protein